MQIIHSVDEMQVLSQQLKEESKSIGLVPTMGYLHEGHLSLVDLVKDKVDCTIVSIFVNPTQFSKGEDLDKYPRNLEHDIELCRERGVSFVFVPEVTGMYLDNFSTSIEEQRISTVLCGASRPTHFRGVTLVCAKLFNICQPSIVVLGQKDAQQVVVLKRMIKDLNFPIEVLVGEIFREQDGLAMSSRNSYLTCEQRKDALLLSQSLQVGQDLVNNGFSDSSKIKEAVLSILENGECVQPDYVEIVNRHTMEDEKEIVREQSILVVAAWVDKVRLIDNQILR
jgi:pantoate--beta-alanine ligase